MVGRTGIQRFRSDRRLGPPDKEQLEQWAGMCLARGLISLKDVFAVLDAALIAVDRSGEWRNWNFLTIQVQFAAEKARHVNDSPAQCVTTLALPEEAPRTEWAQAKGWIRSQIPEIPFLNWFDCTRQVGRCGKEILVEVPDEPTRLFLETEYADVARGAICNLGVEEVRYVVRGLARPMEHPLPDS